MGRLPSVTGGAGQRLRSVFQPRPALVAAALLALPCGCDTNADAPSKSRVQSVLAEPEPASGGGGGSAAVEPAAAPSVPKAEPRPAVPRPPLCEGQLSAKPRAFKPALPPRQLAEDGAGEKDALPPDPLKAARGHWLWINLWAAWCVPCREELPLLLDWQAKLGERLSFAFVSMDDDERQLQAFLQKQPAAGLRRTQWLPDGAVRKAWLEALGLDTEPELPHQVLIDPKGMLRCQVGGAVEPKDLPVLTQILEESNRQDAKGPKKKKK